MAHRLTKCCVVALALVLAAVSPAAAQSGTAKPKSSLSTEINSSLPDNTVGLITPAGVRALNQDFLASWQQAPQVRLVTGTSDTLTAADYGQVIRYNSSNPVAVAIASATSLNPFNVYVQNSNTGTVTITPTGSTIGGLATLVLPVGAYAWIVSDGSNYQIAALGASAGCGAGGFEISNGASFQCSLITANPATINPTPNSTVQALVINQTSPTSGTVAGPLNYNVINVTALSGTTGSDPNLGDVGTQAFRVNLTGGGANATGSGFETGSFWLKETTAGGFTGDRIAVHGVAYSRVTNNNGGFLAGGVFGCRLDDGAALNGGCEGIEIDVGGGCVGACAIAPTVALRYGLHLAIIGASTVGSTADAAFALGNFGANATAWLDMVLLTDRDGFQPLANTANMFRFDAVHTIGSVFNFAGSCAAGQPCNVTITNDFITSPLLRITGPGKASFGSNVVPSAPNIVVATCASCGNSALSAAVDGVTNFDGVSATTANGNNAFALYANEPSRTATAFGFTVGNFVSLTAAGSANLGMLIGTQSNTSIAFGTNNLSRFLIGLGGGFYANGVAGTDKGNGTINVTGCFVSNVACLTGNQTITLSGDVTGSGTTTITTTLANIPNDVVMAGDLLATNVATPAAPAAGKTRVFASTNGVISSINAGGTVANAAQPFTLVSNQFLTSFSATGAFTAAQPSFTNISGTATIGQGGTNATACANTNGVWYYDGTRFVCNVNTTANTILVGNNTAPAFSASPTIGTSVTTPLVIGGTATGSTHEIRSTTGTGSADSVFITGGTNGGTRLATFLGSANQSVFGNSAPPTGLTNVGTYFHPGTDQNTGIIGHLGLSTGVVWFSIADNGSTFLPIEIRGSQIYINDLGASGVSIGTTTVAGVSSLLVAGHVQLGSGTALTLSAGELGFAKITASGTAPGASGAKEEWVCGTNAGTSKRIAYAGTSTTPVTIVDNVGAGVTGC